MARAATAGRGDHGGGRGRLHAGGAARRRRSHKDDDDADADARRGRRTSWPTSAGCRRASRRRPVLVGFAAETDDVVAHARGASATQKGVDLIVANDVSRSRRRLRGRHQRRDARRRRRATRRCRCSRRRAVAARILDRVEQLLRRRAPAPPDAR